MKATNPINPLSDNLRFPIRGLRSVGVAVTFVLRLQTL